MDVRSPRRAALINFHSSRACHFGLGAWRGARSMLGQPRDDDIVRVEQDGFLFVRRDLDEAESSEQENSFNSQQCVTDFVDPPAIPLYRGGGTTGGKNYTLPP